jgi:hypothetical protein
MFKWPKNTFNTQKVSLKKKNIGLVKKVKSHLRVQKILLAKA